MPVTSFDGRPSPKQVKEAEDFYNSRIGLWKPPTPFFEIPKGLTSSEILDIILGEPDPEQHHIVKGSNFTRQHSTYKVKGLELYLWEWIPRWWGEKPYSQWHLPFGPKIHLTSQLEKKIKSYAASFKEDYYNEDIYFIEWGDSEKESLGMAKFFCNLKSFKQTTVPLKEKDCLNRTECYLFDFEF